MIEGVLFLSLFEEREAKEELRTEEKSGGLSVLLSPSWFVLDKEGEGRRRHKKSIPQLSRNQKGTERKEREREERQVRHHLLVCPVSVSFSLARIHRTDECHIKM